MKKVLITSACLMFGVNSTAAVKHMSDNPFSKPSTLPFEAPQFDKIKISDYMPAFLESMRQQRAEMNAIANNKDAPTFENTIVAMERSGQMLARVSAVFDALVAANTNDELDKIQADISPKLSEHQDAIRLNSKLFSRIKILYDTLDQQKEKLDRESLQLIKVYYQQFVLAGANLNAENKIKLAALNHQLATLQTLFQQKLSAATNENKFVVTDLSKLNGLSENEIAAFAQKKNNEMIYIIPLINTTQQPLLQSLNPHETREQLFKLAWNRADRGGVNDTSETIAQIAILRAEKAKLLGYPNYASYALVDQMAETPERAQDFLNQLVPKVGLKASDEAKKIQSFMNQETDRQLQPWDWNYYSEKIRKIEYDVDENELKQYFELNRVLIDGVFWSATQLYGVTFKERYDLPVYHPDVRVFSVFDYNNAPLGLVYLDYFTRDNKNGGAWMSNFVDQSTLLGTKPVVYNVCNFTKPANGQPALLSFDDVITMFHEFGHALHGLFANGTYPKSTRDIARDFVEFPSQFNENWALYPTVLNNYAVNVHTGKPIPSALVEKVKKSQTFNQGHALGETLAAASLDMQWHFLATNAGKQNVAEFETKALDKTHTNFANVPPRYRSSYFLHIWSNGYASSYYAYLWTQMLDHNAYDWFMKNNGMTRENGQRFRDMVLSQGHMIDYAPMFKAFYGKDPDIGPMLKAKGL